MSNGSRVIYTPRSDATPEIELAALANVYSFVLRCAEEKQQSDPAPAPDDAK